MASATFLGNGTLRPTLKSRLACLRRHMVEETAICAQETIGFARRIASARNPCCWLDSCDAEYDPLQSRTARVDSSLRSTAEFSTVASEGLSPSFARSIHSRFDSACQIFRRLPLRIHSAVPTIACIGFLAKTVERK